MDPPAAAVSVRRNAPDFSRCRVRVAAGHEAQSGSLVRLCSAREQVYKATKQGETTEYAVKIIPRHKLTPKLQVPEQPACCSARKLEG